MIRSKYRTRRTVLILAILATAAVAGAESLWESTFKGSVSGEKAFGVGETLLVVLDSGTRLSYKASYIDSRQIQIELSGGEVGELFSFLPTGGSSTNDSVEGSDEIGFTASIAVRIDSVDEAGSLSVSGSRLLRFGGVGETISVAGVVDPKFIDQDNHVPSSAVADLQVVYSSLLSDAVPVIGADDIVRPVPDDIAVGDIAVGDIAVGDATAVGEIADTITGGAQLTEEKRRELLLLYLNRLVDLIFRQR